jgi:hypothetical protein
VATSVYLEYRAAGRALKLAAPDEQDRSGRDPRVAYEVPNLGLPGHGAPGVGNWVFRRDLAGKKYGVPVAALLGGFRRRLPTYASTYHGQDQPGGLDSPEAFADFAEACKELGYTGFKIHGWHDGDRVREARNLLGVRARVGDDMQLMIHPACELRTFMDALYVGRACDEANYFWYEDPYRDAAVSAFGHKQLRDKLKTPLLITEHVRGLEQKAIFVIMGGCDMIHADPEYDMGITVAIKIADLCEALGLDVQLHASGPAQRHASQRSATPTSTSRRRSAPTCRTPFRRSTPLATATTSRTLAPTAAFRCRTAQVSESVTTGASSSGTAPPTTRSPR